MNERLKHYLEEAIMPRNDLNDAGHNREHVNYVRRRSRKFASNDSVKSFMENKID